MNLLGAFEQDFRHEGLQQTDFGLSRIALFGDAESFECQEITDDSPGA